MCFYRLPFAIILAYFSILTILLSSCQNLSYIDKHKDSEISTIIKDKNISVKRLINLAEQGNSEAQLNLGLMYYRGDRIGQDYTQALKWFEKAANQENV
ncbi:tetratricopeptide repeat protein [Psychrobacter phenylpyruvicus]|uniref:Sel1 repeat n=1 Tax=Psychrobacter phenylpyruvicus TaxID=29432 RepID=A0A379LR01_9GAMM|nr:SEL1-like repeat protein [Psychrobacter phenylpyruvicus]SUD92232.1 Sel1 repeat [Psychrobacter phenylpyruvicus]